MSRWNLEPDEDKVYFANCVREEEVNIILGCKARGAKVIYVAFDVIGRTKHECLSYELKRKLEEKIDQTFKMTIEHNYICEIYF